MGTVSVLTTMAFRLIAASVLLSAVSADWSGSGIVTCYGHAQVTADFPDGASNEGQGSIHCAPVEWDSATGLGPEAMIFHPRSGEEFTIWAWDYHPSWGFGDVMPTTTCTGSVWYKTEDMGAGFCTPNKEKDWSGCGMFHCNGDIYCNDC